MVFLDNVSLASYTTFRIGGKARFFCEAKNISDIKEAHIFAREKRLPIFILGGGSNILVSDDGFDGLVLKMSLGGVEEKKIDDNRVEVTAMAGEDWDGFVFYTVKEGYAGLEHLSGIPGTVGAGPVQNIGAYGSEIKDHLLFVRVYNKETDQEEILNKEQCRTEYRHSIFKEQKKYIILSVTFLLEKRTTSKAEYKALKEYFDAKGVVSPSVKGVREAVLFIRKSKLPDLSEVGTAGSFFKNVTILKKNYEELLKKYPELPSFPSTSGKVKIPVGWMIEHVCGLKGYRQGDAGVYDKQALVLVNHGKATATEIQKLAEKIIDCVKQKTGIVLEREVEYVK